MTKASPAAATVNLTPKVPVPEIIAFGDSILDTGNNNYLKNAGKVAKCNFPLYAKIISLQNQQLILTEILTEKTHNFDRNWPF